MKQIINELFRLPMKPKLKNHLRNNLGLVGDELKILNSLLDHDGTYDIDPEILMQAF